MTEVTAVNEKIRHQEQLVITYDGKVNTMQLTITLPDILPNERVSLFIRWVEEFFRKEGISVGIKQEPSSDDPWDNLNIDEIAVDTGIEDFAENHDHYLYGNPKR